MRGKQKSLPIGIERNYSYFGLSSSIVLIMVPPELKNVNEVNV